MISVLLFYKILQLAAIMLCGFILVKSGMIKHKDSEVLSKISLYLLMPAVIINSFDVEITGELSKGIALSFGAAFAIHIVFLGVDWVYARVFRGTEVERASVVYPNSANLIIPIVASVLGDEWVIYTCGFLSVQLLFFWTHGIRLFDNREKFSLKKILLNINIIAIAAGALMMLSGIRLPSGVKGVTESLGSMLGTVAMLIAGMLMAEFDFKKMIANKRLWLVIVMRMIICPLIILALIKAALPFVGIESADKILLISYLASITPSAATIMQFAQVYKKETDFAVAVNIFTTVICIGTMPLLVALYSL